jgi:hypothetical protein
MPPDEIAGGLADSSSPGPVRSSCWEMGSRCNGGKNLIWRRQQMSEEGQISTEIRCPRYVRFPPDRDQITELQERTKRAIGRSEEVQHMQFFSWAAIATTR